MFFKDELPPLLRH